LSALPLSLPSLLSPPSLLTLLSLPAPLSGVALSFGEPSLLESLPPAS
jgi:hypothetical protein